AAAAPYRDPEPFSIDAQGHRLAFYPAGPDRLARLLELIEGARKTIRIAFYIFAPDNSGTRVRDALIAASKRGVRVSLIIDSFGASTDDAFFAGLCDAGGRYRCFMPRWGARYLIRNHQKV